METTELIRHCCTARYRAHRYHGDEHHFLPRDNEARSECDFHGVLVLFGTRRQNSLAATERSRSKPSLLSRSAHDKDAMVIFTCILIQALI
jgi:hypothetical protein